MPKLLVILVLLLSACKTVRQEDLISWVNMPVEALDTHSIFLTLPMYKTLSSEGIEIRNYVNSASASKCFAQFTNTSNKYVSSQAFSTCSSASITCNNIFYIKNGKVLEYAPTGQCFTDKRAQPEKRYYELHKN